MDYIQQVHQYVQQMSSYIQQQEGRIAQLEKNVQELQKKIKELGEQPPIKIDKIEYKFEQLKIDSLDGTLNIGLNPLTPDNLEDIIINEKPEVTFPQGAQPQGQPPQGEQPGQPGGPGPQNPSLKPLDRQLEKQWVSDIHETILGELNQYGFSMVQHVLDERSMMIDESYYEFILEDIKKQLQQRITFYIQQVQPEEMERNFEQIKPQIIGKLYEDMKKGIDAFLTYLPESLKKGGPPS